MRVECGGLLRRVGADARSRRHHRRALTRAQVLRAVADSDEVGVREFNNAFVGMQYYGYLWRKPDQAGFQAWLGVLQAGDVRTMVDGFLNSIEYKLRFGQLASGSFDDTVKIREVKTGRLVRTLLEHTGDVNGVAFSADGIWLASVSNDRSVILWKVKG